MHKKCTDQNPTYFVGALLFVKLKGWAIVAEFYLVTFHPLGVPISSLRCKMCHFSDLPKICLKPLVLIVCFSRPPSLLSSSCLKIQSSLNGCVVGIPLRWSRYLNIGYGATFHSERWVAPWGRRRGVKQVIVQRVHEMHVNRMLCSTWWGWALTGLLKVEVTAVSTTLARVIIGSESVEC